MRESSNLPKVIGKILFQARFINRSYRNRGNVDRAQVQKNTNRTVIIYLIKFEGNYPAPRNALSILK